MSEAVSVPPCYSLLGFNCSSDSSLTLREGTSDVTQCHARERRIATLCQGEAHAAHPVHAACSTAGWAERARCSTAAQQHSNLTLRVQFSYQN